MSADKNAEAGTPTLWDNAWREGHAHGLMNALGLPYREAWQQTVAMLAGKPIKTKTTTGSTTKNARGEWVPSIPVPFYGLRKRCSCGRRFWTMGGYRGHYAVAHILDGHPDGAS